MKEPMTPERVSALAGQAYRELGYRVHRFSDGTRGVLGCPSKTIALMNRFQELLITEIEGDEVAPIKSTPPDPDPDGDVA